MAFAPMSAPVGPGPFQKPPGEIGRSLWLALWSYSFVIVQVVPAQNEDCGAALA